MNNMDKFKEVFGKDPKTDDCPISCDKCQVMCAFCGAGDWWYETYKEKPKK